MPDSTSRQDVPDVEAIAADIRRRIREAGEAHERETAPPAGGPTLEEIEHGARAENNLHENLANANRTHRVGVPPAESGVKGLARRRVYGLLDPLIRELNEHHAATVRVLNKLVRILDGLDTQTSSELLLKTQRRIDLLAQFSRRLAELEELKLDERLRRLEEAVSGPESAAAPAERETP